MQWDYVENKCKEFNVKQSYYCESDTSEKLMHKEILDLKGECDPKENWLNCLWSAKRSILWLDHGRLFKCARSAYIRHFNKYFNYDIPVFEGKDYLDIYKVKDLDEILEFNTKPCTICAYCPIKDWIENLT